LADFFGNTPHFINALLLLRGFHHFFITRPVCRAFWPRMGHGLLARPLESVLMA
jgi:hypothetical protein